jgi:hypothetical protein
MITIEEERWLADTYPGLVPRDGIVAGTIHFNATYNNETGQFSILGDGLTSDLGGVALSCTYKISIENRQDRVFSRLPALHVFNVEPIEGRHFGQADKTACLCSPLEEEDFLRPQFRFRKFLEELVIPFLYGQEFYSMYGYWPWGEYGHGIVGLLESFADRDKIETDDTRNVLRMLSSYIQWPRIREALQDNAIRRHTLCFCKRPELIRRCHPKALAGLRRLLRQVKEQSIPLPVVQAGLSTPPRV